MNLAKTQRLGGSVVNRIAFISFLIFFILVVKMSVDPFLTSKFSHGTFASNMARDFQYEVGSLVTILLLFLIGVFSLFFWKFKKTTVFYFQLVVLAGLPLLLLSFPIFYLISEEIRLETAKVNDVLNEQEIARIPDFTTLKSFDYDPGTQVIKITLQYKKDVILNRYKERKDQELILHELKQFLAWDIGATSTYIWNQTSVPKEMVISLYWDDTLVHASTVFEDTDLNKNSSYHDFDLERNQDQLILKYKLNGKWHQLVIDSN
jgi:ABC-type multidrug transport system fused ATPase/permease subunit